jgi:hypothetical protein
MPDAPGYPLMNGSHFAKSYVNDYLKTDIPVRLVDYRNGWQVDDFNLPTPEAFITYEPLAIDAWPTVITVATSTSKFDRIGHAGADPLYRVTYQMRTYIWVRTEGNEEVTMMRDRLATVVRTALLDYPCLKTYDARTSFRASIDEGTMSEEFSDISLLKGDRAMAGAYLGYTLEIDEVISRRSIGTVSNIGLVVHSAGVEQEISVSDTSTLPISASISIS